jgi:hypothetical protein
LEATVALLQRLNIPRTAPACVPAAAAAAATAAASAGDTGWEGLGAGAYLWLRGRQLTSGEHGACEALAELNDATRSLAAGTEAKAASQVTKKARAICLRLSQLKNIEEAPTSKEQNLVFFKRDLYGYWAVSPSPPNPHGPLFKDGDCNAATDWCPNRCPLRPS